VKKYAVTTKLEILDQAREAITLPTVVIGGMTPETPRRWWTARRRMVAAISSVYQADSVAAAVGRFLALYKMQ
jgi:thiamine-phosphate pyrophosphorylase